MKFTFSIFGDGAARADLETFSRKTAGQINLFPQIPHDQIPGVLAQAHVGVTSLFFTDEEIYQASSPIKLFEYMASGLPILATRMACHSDFTGNSKYVFWIDRVDLLALIEALRSIWEAQASLREMGSLATAAAYNWTWHASTLKLKTALEYGLGRAH
jgi:glycosyltransferase involved in cell wall biosynthesis